MQLEKVPHRLRNNLLLLSVIHANVWYNLKARESWDDLMKRVQIS